MVAWWLKICLPMQETKESQIGNSKLGIPWVGNILWSKKWQTTPVFLPGKIPRTEEPGGLQSNGSS